MNKKPAPRVPNFDAALAHEREISSSLDGRTVMDDRLSKKAGPAQLNLF